MTQTEKNSSGDYDSDREQNTQLKRFSGAEIGWINMRKQFFESPFTSFE
jgi:hypothetical protein